MSFEFYNGSGEQISIEEVRDMAQSPGSRFHGFAYIHDDRDHVVEMIETGNYDNKNGVKLTSGDYDQVTGQLNTWSKDDSSIRCAIVVNPLVSIVS